MAAVVEVVGVEALALRALTWALEAFSAWLVLDHLNRLHSLVNSLALHHHAHTLTCTDITITYQC